MTQGEGDPLCDLVKAFRVSWTADAGSAATEMSAIADGVEALDTRLADDLRLSLFAFFGVGEHPKGATTVDARDVAASQARAARIAQERCGVVVFANL